jgi:photosystem II stability/assembly factor-like uncharacterized protein
MLVVAALLCAAASGLLRAQAPPRADAEFLRNAFESYRKLSDSSPYRHVRWQYLGPTNITGRATDVEVATRTGPRRIYAGFATSGVWVSDDDGATWAPVFDDQPSTSIGDIAVAPSDASIVWVGTGEANLFRASMPGVGIFKSTDAGRTFSHAGLTDTQTIARIVIHPTDPDIVYVAASGHAWTDNETRGVFKTTDGGRTWTKVLYKSPRTGAIDLVMDPSDPNTLYAATWQRIRRKWSDPRVEPGYDESGIYKTTDGGRTWTDASRGLPSPQFRGRIGLDVARSNPRVLYASVDNYEPGRPARSGERDAYNRPIAEARIRAAEIYRSDDSGGSWRRVTEHNELMTGHSGTYGWVFGQIRVDPSDENTIYSLGIGLHVSRDVGRTFTTLEGLHVDHHGLWIDPSNPKRLISANDGGIYLSQDSGASWTHATAAGGVQFYNVTLDSGRPIRVYGSVQDDGSRRGTIDVSGGRDRLAAGAWVRAPGGEGSFHAIDPANDSIVYSHGFYGNFTRTVISGGPTGRGPDGSNAGVGGQRGGGQRGGSGRRGASTPIRPQSDPNDPELRAQWMAPIITSAHRPGTLYAGYQFVYRSRNRGDSWERISPDLTSNDPSRMLSRSPAAIPFQTITALAESPRRRGLLYAGTDDGRLHVTVNDGRTWTDISSRVPTARWYSRVVPSKHADGAVYVTQRGREDDDFGVYVYKSTDFGRTFTSIGSNIPAGSVNVIREDPSRPDVLYLGTDFGAFITTDAGRTWHVLGSGLPSVQVSDLAWHPRDRVIVIATYGRGMFALDAAQLEF